MERINYGLVDSLSKLAQNPREWNKRYNGLTLIQVLGMLTGKSSTVIQHGEEASVYSGVHGQYTNLVRKAQARRTNGVEKQPISKRGRIVLIHKKDGTTVAKRLICGKWCNTKIAIK